MAVSSVSPAATNRAERRAAMATKLPPAATTVVGRRLGGIESIIGGNPPMIPISKRAWLRLCDAGKAPWGIKLGGRRVWDFDILQDWIKSGCGPVRSIKGDK